MGTVIVVSIIAVIYIIKKKMQTESEWQRIMNKVKRIMEDVEKSFKELEIASANNEISQKDFIEKVSQLTKKAEKTTEMLRPLY